MPGPGERAQPLHLGVGGDHRDLVDRLAPAPFSNSSGNVEHHDRRVAHARRERHRAPAPPRDGSALRAAPARPARRAPARRGCCGRRPSGPVVPGKCASISATSAPSGPCSRCTTASASNTGTPSSANIRDTVDLPMPIEPVRPRTIVMTSAAPAVRHRARAAAVRRRRARRRRPPGRSASSSPSIITELRARLARCEQRAFRAAHRPDRARIASPANAAEIRSSERRGNPVMPSGDGIDHARRSRTGQLPPRRSGTVRP